MLETSAREARQHLSHLLDMVEQGEEIIITRRGQTIARLTSVETKIPKRRANMKAFRAKIKAKGKSLSDIIIEERYKDRF